MPYAFTLPTTSALSYDGYLQSPSHPSSINAATLHRSVLRSALKKHKKLSLSAQAPNLTNVQHALLEYIPYLIALDAGFSGKLQSDEEINVILQKDIAVEWRPCLASGIPGSEAARVPGKGLDYELSYVLTTLAYLNTALARIQLHVLYAPVTPSPDQRTSAITTASKCLLEASSLHQYIAARASEVQFPSNAVDVSSPVQNALSYLALSEATLLAVLKDDSYPALVAQNRNKSDREWMIKAPEIPRLRINLLARVCLAAAEHSGKALALLTSPGGQRGNKITETLVKYTKDLQMTSRAKACRFLGIGAEVDGQTGEAIAWLIAGKRELGFKVNEEQSSSTRGLARFKKDWLERMEDKKVEKGGVWGSDAGRFEEARVIEMLDKKWNKQNDLVRYLVWNRRKDELMKVRSIPRESRHQIH